MRDNMFLNLEARPATEIKLSLIVTYCFANQTFNVIIVHADGYMHVRCIYDEYHDEHIATALRN